LKEGKKPEAKLCLVKYLNFMPQAKDAQYIHNYIKECDK